MCIDDIAVDVQCLSDSETRATGDLTIVSQFGINSLAPRTDLDGEERSQPGILTPRRVQWENHRVEHDVPPFAGFD